MVSLMMEKGMQKKRLLTFPGKTHYFNLTFFLKFANALDLAQKTGPRTIYGPQNLLIGP